MAKENKPYWDRYGDDGEIGEPTEAVGVYRRPENELRYHATIKHDGEWMYLGEFNDFSTAKYVANLGVLGFEVWADHPELNEVDEKDCLELAAWREDSMNKELERMALRNLTKAVIFWVNKAKRYHDLMEPIRQRYLAAELLIQGEPLADEEMRLVEGVLRIIQAEE